MVKDDVFGWPVGFDEKPYDRGERWGHAAYTTEDLLEFFMSRGWNMSPFPLYPRDEKIFKGAIVSIAASGPRIWHDRIFNISILTFHADRFGNMYQIQVFEDLFGDPRRKICKSRLSAMKIEEEALLGAKFDHELINRVIGLVDFVVLYDASRRRPMLEAEFPIFKTKPFVCSKRDIFWSVWRMVPPGRPPLETYAAAHGRKYGIDRPSDEVLLTAWLFSQPNPKLKDETRYYRRLPRLLGDVVRYSQHLIARIFIEDGRTDMVNLLVEEGFRRDRVTKVWYKDVLMEWRYSFILRVRKLFFNDEHVPITWMPVNRVRAHTKDKVRLPSKEEEHEMLMDLPVSTLLQTPEDTLGIVPHPRQVRQILAAHAASPLPPYRGLQDLIESGDLL